MWHYFWAHRVYHCSRACPKHRARKCPLWVMYCGLSELWCWDVVYMWWSCGVTWGHVMVMWCYKRSCDGHVTSWYHVMLQEVMWWSCDLMWYHVMLQEAMWWSCDLMWCYKRSCDVIGASLSEPHTSVTALLDTCVCVYVCLCVAIYRKFKLSERVSILHVLKRIHARWTMVN